METRVRTPWFSCFQAERIKERQEADAEGPNHIHNGRFFDLFRFPPCKKHDGCDHEPTENKYDESIHGQDAI